PYEASGFVPSPMWKKIHKFKKWYDGDTANLSIGQAEVLVTPLQMTRMMAFFANGGYLVTPYVLKSVGGRDLPKQKKKIKLNFNDYNIRLINEGLRETISDPAGTANVLSGLGVEIAGKTGTAQAPPRPAHGWFLGYFPYKKPKYVLCVFLEHGHSGYYSCLVAKRIIEEMIRQGLI
ncbi:MAG: penicillin-binding transpeptidase domain-containing protein, partial [Candidatus Omnitrophica bacterium]|nr:penicillin-binding transpeptidase domain-containing protein [Candidatus Omnitrophota bacterium]